MLIGVTSPVPTSATAKFNVPTYRTINLKIVHLTKLNFREAISTAVISPAPILPELNFSKSYIYGCDFTGADFTGVVVKAGGFSGVVNKSGGIEKNTIANAVWNRTSFIDTQIADVVFAGTLEDCYFENCVFTRVTFQDSTLINTFFKNKSLKQIRFIDCQADRMTYEFLKNGKANLNGITLLTS